MKLVCISDTHCRLRKVKVPPGDLLIHAGDLTFQGNVQEIGQELRELGRVAKNFKYGCVLICGNHDWLGQRNPSLMREMCKENGITYIDHECITIEGIKIFGSAYTPWFHNWAFNVERGEKIKELWDQIPQDTQVLVTHGPPHNILDNVSTFNGPKSEWIVDHVGCEDLAARIKELPDLKLHIFGHLHDGYGIKVIDNITYINPSSCNEEYKPVNSPIIFDLQTT